VIDLEVFGAPAFLEPQYCTLSRPYPGGSNNRVGNPMFVREYETRLTAVAFNMEPDFKTVRIVTAIPEAEGDYHLTASSTTAIDRGTPRVTRVVAGQLEVFQAPARDFDGDLRPRRAGYDIGADEL
ncbi:MAG: hypothetical protein AB1816_04665, partial [Bacillota bacterium]